MMNRFVRHLMLILILIPLLCSSALAADYSITNYSMDIHVLPDGSAEVTETLIYDFDGKYNGILSLFDTDGLDGISDFHAFIDGTEMLLTDSMDYLPDTYTVTEDGPLAEIRIYSPGRSDVRAVTYEYVMEGLAKRYEDTALIRRRFIGENNAVPLQNALVTVTLPGEGEIRAFIRGAMDETKLTAGSGCISAGPETIEPGETVELRLIFPASLISEASLSGGAMLDKALEEERLYEEEQKLKAERLRIAKYLLASAYCLIFFGVWLLLMKKYGLKGRIAHSPSPERLLSWPAAFAAAVAEDEPDTDALTGTLMELVQQNFVAMQPEDSDIRLIYNGGDVSGLRPHQQQVIRWLFSGQESILLAELNAGTNYERAQAFEKGYAEYCAAVTSELNEEGVRQNNDGVRIAVNALLVILGIMIAGGILLAGEANILLAIVMLGVIFLLLYLMSRVRRLTDTGEMLQADALALREAGIDEKRLIEFLPYYAALGMTEPLIQAVSRTSFAGSDPVFLYTGWHIGLNHMARSMRDIHHHNASVPNPSASSSSGGGGSRGGGGGHGAW